MTRDGRPVGVGATGEQHSRSAMSLVNVAYSAVLTWSNPDMKLLEEQALVPMFGEHPVELGLREGDPFLPMLRSDPKYRQLFAAAFPAEQDAFNVKNVTKALACFERSIIAARSPYDRYHYGGDDSAVSESAKRGEILFFSQPISCFRCHGGFNFSDAAIKAELDAPGRGDVIAGIGLLDLYPVSIRRVPGLFKNVTIGLWTFVEVL